ncbi:MAG: aminoglycoside 3'-phosphotransferase [Acidimicrobiales bacterium]|nr:aminoglycoside 3'-phosphotransferase [Acidimicrobiales bacterium]
MSTDNRDDRMAGPPVGDIDVPDVVRELANGQPIMPVWENQLGGLTFRLGDGETRRFVKWAATGSGVDLAAERDRLMWAGPYLRVPEVLDFGTDADQSWLVTAGLAGESAASSRWKAEPAVAARAIGVQLRAVHDALPVETCPFSRSVETRLATGGREPSDELLSAPDWRPDFRGVTVREALRRVAEVPPIDALVVCHGDPCAPNTLITADGRPAGVVDLGSMGVADRWADIAVATWSADWNFGPGWQQALLDGYGIDADPERTEYYRLLWELG